MEINYYKEYSSHLDHYMEFKVYGTKGQPCIVIPAQNGRFYDYENFDMVECVKPYIESGRLQLFCIDSYDIDTWSNVEGDESHRIEKFEKYVDYIFDEVIQRVKEINGSDTKPFLTGCSMGATHSLNLYLRRPDLFSGCIALSGVYRADFFFENYHDERIYFNSPTDYLPNMPKDHPFIDLYRQGKIIACVGQGAWEDGLNDLRIIDQALKRLEVPAIIDFWGYDVDHDWPWWQKQIQYFMPYMLGDKKW